MSVTPSIASTLHSVTSSKPLSIPVMVTLNTLSCPLVSPVPPALYSHTSMTVSATVLIVSPLPIWMISSSIPILSEHILHIQTILQKLLSTSLYTKLEKCEFHMEKVSFLGFIISPEGISMDPERIRTVAEWPIPESILDIQVFLGFSNFYRRFIEGYSCVVLLITCLLCKGQPFEWSIEAQASFDKLKSLFTSTPIFRHFDLELPTTVHVNSSGFAISGIMSQYDADGILHPIAFWSQKCIPTECNYDIHD